MIAAGGIFGIIFESEENNFNLSNNCLFLGYKGLGELENLLFSLHLSHLDGGWNQVSKWSSGFHEDIGTKDLIFFDL